MNIECPLPTSTLQLGATARHGRLLRDYGKVLEFPSADLDSCLVQIYRDVQSGRTNISVFLRSELEGGRFRTETLGPPAGDLMDELREFRKRMIEPFDDRFIWAANKVIDALERDSGSKRTKEG